MYERKYNAENFGRLYCDYEGQYDTPVIKPERISEPPQFISFNYARTTHNKVGKGLHFFIDDYQFMRLWTRSDQYIDMLKGFDCVMTPDFSMFTDYPLAMQIYNHYRKHWLGAYWQDNGIKVIPTICWSDKKSFDWCFDGEPHNSVVAVSSVGTQQSKETKEAFLLGYNEMIRRLQPEKVIFYGNIPTECRGNIVHIKAFQDKFKEAKISG